MAKAVLITSANQAALANRYAAEIEDREPLFPVGWYLVVKTFGDDHNYDIVNGATLEEFFVRTGKSLENDFFEVVGVGGQYRTD